MWWHIIINQCVYMNTWIELAFEKKLIINWILPTLLLKIRCCSIFLVERGIKYPNMASMKRFLIFLGRWAHLNCWELLGSTQRIKCCGQHKINISLELNSTLAGYMARSCCFLGKDAGVVLLLPSSNNFFFYFPSPILQLQFRFWDWRDPHNVRNEHYWHSQKEMKKIYVGQIYVLWEFLCQDSHQWCVCSWWDSSNR